MNKVESLFKAKTEGWIWYNKANCFIRISSNGGESGSFYVLEYAKTLEAVPIIGYGTVLFTEAELDVLFQEWHVSQELFCNHYDFFFFDKKTNQRKVREEDIRIYGLLCNDSNIFFPSPAIECLIIRSNDGGCAYRYLNKHHDRKYLIPIFEPIIANSSSCSLYYAINFLKDRFPLGEPTIAKDFQNSYRYARDIIKGRWLPGEEAIATNAETAFEYAKHILKGRFELGEPTIAKDSIIAFEYAKCFIKGRWHQGEQAILRGSHAEKYKVLFLQKQDWSSVGF